MDLGKGGRVQVSSHARVKNGWHGWGRWEVPLVSIIALTSWRAPLSLTTQSSRALESRDPMAFTLLGSMCAPYGSELVK